MFQKIKTLAIVIGLYTALLSGGMATQAQSVPDMEAQLRATAESGAGFSEPRDPRTTVAIIIYRSLEVIGIIFIVLILYAGFLWMTAGGDDDGINKAKDILKAAIIGLIIILTAYGITRLIFTYATTATHVGGRAGEQMPF